ncbi:MAG TPA: ribonuclease Z [Gemmatimonadaceae bacterium]|jgi:ribonuclease Z|nr:ribonuclease Z [Gemmatimonadaceae bacterium]
MSLSVRFLGTSAARPTVERNVSSIAVIREGETLLFDCGEGTQRQMMRYGITFALNDVFITHFHGDHIIGVIGLFRTLALQGRTEPMRMFGPRGAARVLRGAAQFGVDRVGFPVEITEVAPGEPIARDGYSIIPFATTHSGEVSVGYALAEEDRKGRFDPDIARSLGIPEGPLWGKIHKGESVTLDDGRVIESSALVGPRRSGRTLVITGDTRPSDATIEASRGADLLVHEATFADEEAVRASETGHSTAREAAKIAAAAGVRRLALTHFSARYSRDPGELLREAREEFGEVVLARDGMELEIPFPDERIDGDAGTADPAGARAAADPASSPRR